MPIDQIILTVASGAVVGFSLGLVGGGGSVLAVPLLVYVVGVSDPHVAIGTSALAVGLNAAWNLITHFKAGNVKFGCAATFAIFGILGAIVGSTIGKTMDGDRLLALFGLVMILIGATMVRKPREIGNDDVHLDRETAGRLLPRMIPAALGVGFLSGFFGIGGGFLIVPGLIMSTGMPLLNAVGSSLMSVTTFGLTTAANYALSGFVDFALGAFLIAGGLVGGLLGVRTAGGLAAKKPALTYTFAVVVVVVGVYVVWKGLPALLSW